MLIKFQQKPWIIKGIQIAIEKKKDSCVGSNKIFYINNIKHIETASQLY